MRWCMPPGLRTHTKITATPGSCCWRSSMREGDKETRLSTVEWSGSGGWRVEKTKNIKKNIVFMWGPCTRKRCGPECWNHRTKRSPLAPLGLQSRFGDKPLNFVPKRGCSPEKVNLGYQHVPHEGPGSNPLPGSPPQKKSSRAFFSSRKAREQT